MAAPPPEEGLTLERLGAEPVAFFDPHFHIWDIPGGVHCATTLAAPGAGHPSYTMRDYEAAVAAGCAANPWVQHVGGVFVEALAKSPAAECRWATEAMARQLAESRASDDGQPPKRYGLCARVDFSHNPASAMCAAHDAMNAATVDGAAVTEGTVPFVGLRHIVNFRPSWPHVEKELLTDATWRANVDEVLALMKAAPPGGAPSVFEVHCNPHQIPAAVDLVKAHPTVRFVLNHLGVLALGEEDDAQRAKVFDQWRSAVEAFAAASDRTYVKISAPEYATPAWETDPWVAKMIATVVAAFGAKRLMLATNLPVSADFLLVGDHAPKASAGGGNGSPEAETAAFNRGAPPAALFRWCGTALLAALGGDVDGLRAAMGGTALEAYGFAGASQ